MCLYWHSSRREVSNFSQLMYNIFYFAVVGDNTPLPTFSAFVSQNLARGNARLVWGKMIAEAAHYYIAKFPDIKDSTEYQAVGRQMLARYPSIKHEGKEAWVSFLLLFGQSLELTIVVR